MNKYGKQIKSFFNNPLGIIGMFLVLTEGIAAFVITQSQLEFTLNLILVIFIVLFPVLTLCCFVYLVIKHHKKLYGPSDYKDEANFLTTFNYVAEKQMYAEVKPNNKELKPFLDNELEKNDEEGSIVVLNNKIKNNDVLIERLEKSNIKWDFYIDTSPSEHDYDDPKESIWLGKKVPLEFAKAVLKICFQTDTRIKYIRLPEESDFFDVPEYVHREIFIGGSTKTSINRGTKPLTEELKKEILDANSIEKLHNLIKNNYIE